MRGSSQRAKDTSLRSRINKNINMLSLEGQTAPPIGTSDSIGAAPASLARVWQKQRDKGLALIAPTRYYGSVGDKDATPAEEKEQIAKVWKESYAGLEGVPVVIDTEAMVRYGVSATPSFVLLDRQGLVRLYAPTRLSEAELARRIDAVLAEAGH